MNKFLDGLGKLDRARIAALIRGTKGTTSVGDTAEILDVSSEKAAKMLSRWAQKGWFSRIKRGLYIPIPLESRSIDVPVEDPWVIADRLYRPCYIGGWSAAEYLDLTEQIFNTILVMTLQKPRDRSPKIKNTSFKIRTISEKAFFGLKPIWRDRVKIPISDPTRTILDILSNPLLGGGIRFTKDILSNYLNSENKNLELLTDYAVRLGNGAVFKRLGFLLEMIAPEETKIIDQCSEKLTAGNTKLDPMLRNEKLVTRWRLWVPENWKRLKQND